MNYTIIPIVRAESLIPRGQHCYTRLPDLSGPSLGNHGMSLVKPCPFWGIDAAAEKTHGRQESGYCGYLKSGDWMEAGASLLWDQVKECHIKDSDEC